MLLPLAVQPHVSMDRSGGRESLGLQVSPLFFFIRPEGALSTGSLSGAIPEVEPDFAGDLYGTPFTSTWSIRGNPPAPEVMPGASQSCAGPLGLLYEPSRGPHVQSQLSLNNQWACPAPAPPGGGVHWVCPGSSDSFSFSFSQFFFFFFFF